MSVEGTGLPRVEPMQQLDEVVSEVVSAPSAPHTMQRDEPPPGPKPTCATDAEADEWSTVWWTAYEPHVKAHAADLYHSPLGLYELLEERDGKPAPVKLLRLSWLLRRATKLMAARTHEQRQALALPRRQLLEQHEPEAFLSVEEVRALGRSHAGDPFETCGGFSYFDPADKPLKILSISHGWLTPQHPDPFGQQLAKFAAQVWKERRMVKDLRDACMYPVACGMCHGCCCFVVPCLGQQCGHTARQLPSGEFGVFYDYGSLHQKDEHGERTPAEREAFSTALETMGVWYGHRLTTTFISAELPDGWPRRPEDAPFFPLGWLKGKGWPTFERAVSNMVKRASDNTFRRIVDPLAHTVGFYQYREAPAHPRTFAARLGRVIFTNGKQDCELVAGLYADTLAGAFGHAKLLEYKFAMWTDEEAQDLASALPLAQQVEELDLAGNVEIGQRGLDALAEAIRGGAAPRLQTFRFESTWEDERKAALEAACHERGIKVAVGGPG